MSNFTQVPNIKKSPLLIIAVIIIALILLVALVGSIKSNPTGFMVELVKNPPVWFLLAIIGVVFVTSKKEKKLSITSKIILIAVPISIIFIVYIAYAPISKYVQAPCSNCSTDLTVTTDCVANYETWKEDKDFIAFENTLGISEKNIQKTIKVIQNKDGVTTVFCRYYGPSKSLFGN